MADEAENGAEVPLSQREQFKTDTGRTVYGGGGITPDVMVKQPQLSRTTQLLEVRSAIFNYAVEYAAKHPDLTKDVVVSPAVVEDFVRHASAAEIAPEADVREALTKVEDRKYIERALKAEIVAAKYGFDASYPYRLQGDAQVEKALQMLPEAQKLATVAADVRSRGGRENRPLPVSEIADEQQCQAKRIGAEDIGDGHSVGTQSNRHCRGADFGKRRSDGDQHCADHRAANAGLSCDRIASARQQVASGKDQQRACGKQQVDATIAYISVLALLLRQCAAIRVIATVRIGRRPVRLLESTGRLPAGFHAGGMGGPEHQHEKDENDHRHDAHAPDCQTAVDGHARDNESQQRHQHDSVSEQLWVWREVG